MTFFLSHLWTKFYFEFELQLNSKCFFFALLHFQGWQLPSSSSRLLTETPRTPSCWSGPASATLPSPRSDWRLPRRPPAAGSECVRCVRCVRCLTCKPCRSYTVTGVEKEGPYHWAGKMFLSKLSPATQYKARASAQNELGWSQAGHEWSFATLGAGTELKIPPICFLSAICWEVTGNYGTHTSC